MARIRAEEKARLNARINAYIKGHRPSPKRSEEYRERLLEACEADDVVVLSGNEYTIRKRQSPTPPRSALTIKPPPAKPASTTPKVKRDPGNGMKLAPARVLRRVEPIKIITTVYSWTGSYTKDESVGVPKKLFTCEGTKDQEPNKLELLLAEMEKNKQGK